MESGMMEAIKRRTNATERLFKALKHLPTGQQIAIITSFIPLDDLEEIADFQEHRNHGGIDGSLQG